MVKKGGNGSSRGKFNQRGGNGGRPNGGGMNDYRNRSQMSSSNGIQQRQSNGGSYGGGGNGAMGQRPMSRFSNVQNGGSSAYQPRSYGNNLAGIGDASSKPAYTPRPMNGTGSAEQPKYAGFQSKPPPPAIANIYAQQPHAAYPSVMATAAAPSLYSMPPPPFSSAQSGLPFNYPPPVLPVKN